MALRDYQQRAIDQLFEWFSKNEHGNPCIEMPTASGKSHVIAELCRHTIQNWPDQKILVMTHVKELIEQDAEKILMAWPEAPMGIYSAGLGLKQLGEPITIAGIQSIRKKAHEVGVVDLVIVDEAHLISHKDEGGYRNLIKKLTDINPALRVIGLTATPYRLGHGLITDKPALFDEILTPTSIEELIAKGYLAPLWSKDTKVKLSTEGVSKRGGEFVESELQKAVNTEGQNSRIVDETISRAGDRKAWLFFCSGVKHAIAMRDVLIDRGIPTACVLGETPKDERNDILTRFKCGELRAVTNANVLTTGFNYPDIDLIAMCRPTMSTSLYCQMAGRGMRVKSEAENCMVLDFAGVVKMHGPVQAVRPVSKKQKEQPGEAPIKVCDECNELVPLAMRVCPACGYEFPAPKIKELKLHNDDIMGINKDEELIVGRWEWRTQFSYTSGIPMAVVSYYGYGIGNVERVSEYICLCHGGYAEQKAIQKVRKMCQAHDHFFEDIPGSIGTELSPAFEDLLQDRQASLSRLVEMMNKSEAPQKISYRKDGKFFNIFSWDWGDSD